MTSQEKFTETYKKSPLAVAFTPYRVCPLGAHVDHQLGKITGFAIDKGVHIAYGPKQNGIVEISSLQFDKRAQWHILSVPEFPEGDWADHLRGATLALSKRYTLRTGLCAVIDGELPIGGLSSSAAVIITFLSAISAMNGIVLSEEEMIEIALEAENSYVGVSCGKLDQCCEVYCKKDSLLYMDMRTGERQAVPAPKNMPAYKIAIFFSGVERTLVSSKYNARVDEAKSTAYALKAYAGMDYGKQKDTFLSDVPREVFEKYKHLLPAPWANRAEHYYSEVERAERGAEAWKNGDLAEFGRLIFESGRSSIEKWDTGSDELKALYDIMTETDGIYGGRFSGAGFKGCCMAIIDPAKQDEIIREVGEKYIARFPHLSEKFTACICDTSDGVKLK